jgi:hypothetical protein
MACSLSNQGRIDDAISRAQGGGGYPSMNQIQKQIERGQAPKTIKRAESDRRDYNTDHIHFTDGSALYKNGTWKHGGKQLTNKEKEWLESVGWELPVN